MRTIENYIQAMLDKDYVGLSQLFDDNGSYHDYCPAVSQNQHEYHIFGREAIEMFMRNKFAFYQYGIQSPTIISDNEATFISNLGGYYIKAVAKIEELDGPGPEGRIVRLVVRPR